MNKTISIIVPIFNQEKYLEKCVESLLNQTYKDIEIVLVDDGSNDRSLEICYELAKKDSRIKVYPKPNGGVSETRNYGVSVATGDFIGFVDSDDYIHPKMYEILYDEIEKNDADVSSISISMVRANGEYINGTNTGIEYVYEGDEIIRQLLLHNMLKNYSCDKLFKKELFEGIQYPVGKLYEDVVTTLLLLMKAKKVAYKDDICYYYVKHKDTISATCSKKNVTDYLDAIISRYKLLENREGIEDCNLFAIANTMIHAYYKVMLSGLPLTEYDEYLQFLRERCQFILDNKEKEITSMFSVYQKACFYMYLYDEELFVNFLRDRQRKMLSNSAS